MAIGEVKAQIRCSTASQPLTAETIPGGILDPACPVVGTSNTEAGWTVGGGSEFALTENWSVKAEASYFNLGTRHYSFGSFLSKVAVPSGFDVPSPLEADVRRVGWIANIGLNYRFTGFGEAPLIAKY